MEAPTKEEGPGRDRGTSTSPSKTSLAQQDPAAADKWRNDWRRRVERAVIDERYFNMCPKGVQEAALRFMGRDGGDAA